MELLVHNSIYLATGPEQNKCYVQLSGEPLCDLKLVHSDQTPKISRTDPLAEKGTSSAIKNKSRNTKPLSIPLPRNKIFYAQTKLQDGRATFKFGLPRHRTWLHMYSKLISRYTQCAHTANAWTANGCSLSYPLEARLSPAVRT